VDSIARYYREINPGFLDREISLKLDVYSKVENGGSEPAFIKFADYYHSCHKKVLGLLQNSDGQS